MHLEEFLEDFVPKKIPVGKEVYEVDLDFDVRYKKLRLREEPFGWTLEIPQEEDEKEGEDKLSIFEAFADFIALLMKARNIKKEEIARAFQPYTGAEACDGKPTKLSKLAEEFMKEHREETISLLLQRIGVG